MRSACLPGSHDYGAAAIFRRASRHPISRRFTSSPLGRHRRRLAAHNTGIVARPVKPGRGGALQCQSAADVRRREPANVSRNAALQCRRRILQRPFKIRRLGHFGFNVEKSPRAREFYGDLLGFTASDTLDFSRAPWFPKDADLGDPRGYFMRYGPTTTPSCCSRSGSWTIAPTANSRPR